MLAYASPPSFSVLSPHIPPHVESSSIFIAPVYRKDHWRKRIVSKHHPPATLNQKGETESIPNSKDNSKDKKQDITSKEKGTPRFHDQVTATSSIVGAY
jgi:hypothetical protein